MKRLTHLLFIAFIFPMIGYSQTPVSSSSGLPGNTMTLPIRYADKYSNDSRQDVDFVSYPYVNDLVDIRDYKSRYPKLNAPDFIAIKSPASFDKNHAVILISLFSTNNPTEEDLVIWFATGYETMEVSFHIDNNQDRDFTNDGLPTLIEAGKKAEKIIATGPLGSSREKEFWIAVPRPTVKVTPKLRRGYRMGNGFYVGASASVGFGDLKYEFDNLETGFPTWYDSKYTQNGIGLSVGYGFRRFQIGLSGALQSQKFYTTYFNIRTDVPEITTDINGIERRIENVETNRNIDKHSNSRYQFSVDASFRLRLNSSLELQPLVSYGLIAFRSGEYIADRRDEAAKYTVDNTKFLEGGFKIAFHSQNNRSFHVAFMANKLYWKPQSFHANIQHENLDIAYKSIRCVIGYNFHL